MINKNMENKAKMSNEQSQLDGIHESYITDHASIRESNVDAGVEGLKTRIRNFKLDLSEKASCSSKPKRANKYTKEDIANRAIDVFNTRINPVTPDMPEEQEQPVTHAHRTNLKAISKSLAGMRNGGNAGKMTQTGPNGGDLGQYTSPASTNGGDLGNNTGYGQYYGLTTNMTLEQYQEHISNLFEGDKEETRRPVCGVCASDPCECEVELEESPVDDLKDELREMTDHSWQAIDKVMRKIASEYDITPKQLHKDFKSEEGMIPDEWIKVNEEVQLCGYMPLDEVTAIMKVGQVYEVSLIWRGGTYRVKFFWPETTIPTREDMQTAVEMFYPGGRLMAHYPCKDDPDNYMVIVPAFKENYEFVPEDTWEELTEELDEFYNYLCEEVGEPQGPLVLHEDGMYHIKLEDHDTGDTQLITFGEDMSGMSQKSGDKRSTESGAGMTAKGVAKYNSRTGGNLKTAVTTPPSKLKPGSKAAGRRKSFCARSRGWNGERGKAARRRWNC